MLDHEPLCLRLEIPSHRNQHRWPFKVRSGLGGCKMGLKGIEENRPGGELTVAGHPLELGQSTTIHIKRGDG